MSTSYLLRYWSEMTVVPLVWFEKSVEIETRGHVGVVGGGVLNSA